MAMGQGHSVAEELLAQQRKERVAQLAAVIAGGICANPVCVVAPGGADERKSIAGWSVDIAEEIMKKVGL